MHYPNEPLKQPLQATPPVQVPILIVDDDATKRLALTTALSPLGHTIVEADSGQAALRRVLEQDFAVILIDVSMPILNGFETAAFIRERRQSEMTPIIFITAHANDELDTATRYAEGAVDFMFAPVQPDELRAKVSVFAKLFIKAQELATQAEDVQVSADQLRLLTDAAPIGIFRTDVEGRFVYTNPRWTEIMCIPAEEAAGQDWDSILRRERRTGFDNQSDQPRPEESQRFEIKIPGAASRFVVVTSEPIPGTDGGSAGRVGTLADVTAETRAEQARAESERRFRQLADAMPQIVWSADADGATDYLNQRWFEYSGISVEQTENLGWRTVLHPDELDRCNQHVRQSVETGDPIELEGRMRRASDGEYRWHLIRGVPVRDDLSRVTKWLGTCTDIHEQRLGAEALRTSEHHLRQAQKMEAVGQLAGGIAHDFNNILAVVLNYAEFVAESLAEGDEGRSDLQQIINAGERGAELVRQLLAFSRQEVIQPTVIDLNEVVTGMAVLLDRSVGEDIQLGIETPAGLSMTMADQGQLEQILLNLVLNARDSMAAGGRIDITTSNVQLEAGERVDLPTGSYACLSVTDTGSGIQADVLDHIFEPFFTTKKRGKGTGLGLSTVYGIVKQARGGIYADSEMGVGTSFVVYLPVTDEKASTPALPPIIDSVDEASILVVEDEDPVRELIGRILRREGFDVTDVASGAEAVAICSASENRFDLLLTDVVMPQMSGPALRDLVLPLRPEMKVLYMSGYTDELIAKRGVLAAGETLLAKPFNSGQLLTRVREALHSDKLRTAEELEASI